MMKKFLAILLACMMIPSAVLADSFVYRFEAQLGEEPFSAFVYDMLEQIGTVDRETMDSVLGLVCDVLELASVECVVQDNGFKIDVLLQGNSILNAAVTAENNELLISTSLLKDRILALDYSYAAEKLGSVDWNALATAFDATANEWQVTRDVSYDAFSNFAGAAYENGNERIVFHLNDTDIALLLEGLLLDVEQSDLISVLKDVYGDEAIEIVLQSFREFNYSAAIANEYEYDLAVVYYTDTIYSEFVGASLNVLHNGEEAWSLSYGMDEYGDRVIAAFHVGDMTNYFAYTQTTELISSRETKNISTFGIYQVKQGVSYADAAADMSNALLYNETIYNSVVSGTEGHFRMVTNGTERSVVEGVEQMSVRIEVTEDYAESPLHHQYISKAYLKDDADPIVTQKSTVTACEPFTHPEAAERISVAELFVNPTLQDELVQAISEDAVTEMGVIVFKSLPAELLVEIMQLMQ